MDRSGSSSETSTSSNRSSPSQSPSSSSLKVVSIECLKGSLFPSDGYSTGTDDLLQTGDIVEELHIGSTLSLRSPFPNGRIGIQKILSSAVNDRLTSAVVGVRRGISRELSRIQVVIVPGDSLIGRKQCVLRSINDPRYVVGFVHRTESECLEIQATRSNRMVGELTRSKLQSGEVSYPWEKKMEELVLNPNSDHSSPFLSMLLLPKASDQAGSSFNDLDNTLARANAWLHSAQAYGVPIVFINIQSESLLSKISGETASSTVSVSSLSDLPNIANTSLYGFEDYHGVDIGVIRAVRLWYVPIGGELAIRIHLKEGDSKLGFAISRTEEGFIYISSVIEGDDNAPSTRSGLSYLYKEAMKGSKLLVISRISNQKVLPWLVSSTGAIRCFDTVSVSHKLSLHRHARAPLSLHVFLWDHHIGFASSSSSFDQSF